MKNLLLVLSISLLAVTNSIAQDKGYISISVGPSFPISDFGSKDLYDDSAGLAKTGAIFDISFAYKLGKNFGIAALLRGQSNPTDTKLVGREIANGVPGNVDVHLETGNWSLGSMLVGGYGSFPINSKLSFESRLLLGYSVVTSPEIDTKLSDGTYQAWIKQESMTSGTFSYLIGAGFKYNAGKRLCLLANFDYSGAKPEFKDVEVVASDGSFETTTFSQRFQTINIGVGVGYRL